MKSLTYGTMPKRKEFLAAYKKEVGAGGYDMTLVGDAETAVTEAINQGIDAHLEAVGFKQGSDRYGKLALTINDGASLHTLVRRLAENSDEGNEEAGSLASDILGTLGFEWV